MYSRNSEGASDSEGYCLHGSTQIAYRECFGETATQVAVQTGVVGVQESGITESCCWGNPAGSEVFVFAEQGIVTGKQ